MLGLIAPNEASNRGVIRVTLSCETVTEKLSAKQLYVGNSVHRSVIPNIPKQAKVGKAVSLGGVGRYCVVAFGNEGRP